MGIDKKDPFYWRAFVTFYIVLSFLVIAASGFVLFISPPGRVATPPATDLRCRCHRLG